MIPFNYFFYEIPQEYILVSWDGTMKILARWGMLGEQDCARAYYLWHGQVALKYTWQRKSIWSVYPVFTSYRQDERISQLLLRALPWFHVSCFSCKSISWWHVVVKEWVILPAPPWQFTSFPALLILPPSVTKIPMCYVANSENTFPKHFPESDLFYQHLLDNSLPAAHIAFTVTKWTVTEFWFYNNYFSLSQL